MGLILERNVTLSQLKFEECIDGPIPSSELKRQVAQLLEKGNSNLVICNMGNLGHGAFAAKRIEKDTVIAVYAGTIIFGRTEDSADEGLRFKASNISFSTAKHRGIASFLQHLPIKPMLKDVKTKFAILKQMGEPLMSSSDLKLNEDLYCTEFSMKKIRETIATVNVRKEFINYNGFPLAVLV